MINFSNAALTISAVSKNQFCTDLPQIIFCGRSNVGKSSMINCLLSRKSLAYTSSKPGKTATINFYNIDNKMYFVDLPGYGYAKVSHAQKVKWASFMEDYFKMQTDKRLAISIIDIRHDPSVLDIEMAQMLYDMKIPFIVVATKADKLSKTTAAKRCEELENEYDPIPVIAFSASKGSGKTEILKLIADSIYGADDF